MKNIDQRLLAQLTKAFSVAKTQEEFAQFLAAILTPAELQQVVMRWQIVKGLIEEKESQRDLAERLKISIGKISRGARELKMGSGIFQKIYRRLHGA